MAQTENLGLETIMTQINLNPAEGLLVLAGNRLQIQQLNSALHTVILHVDSRLIAERVKPILMNLYAPDFPVTVIAEQMKRVRLDQLDHLVDLPVKTTLYLAATEDPPIAHRQFSKLIEIVEILRAPNGCPWDREQTHESIRKNVIEEAYEVAEAIDLKDASGLCEELGDLLLQVALHAQMASEEGSFTVYDAIQAINDKLIRRHPHVFGNRNAENADAAEVNWEEIKRQEKRAKGLPKQTSILDAVSSSLPAISVAYKLQSAAGKVGFEWEDIDGVYQKLQEELEELRVTTDKTEELGDVLFVLVNLARYLKVDPEEALAITNLKFRRRFGYIEKKLSEQGKSFSDSTLEEMDAWWNEAKIVEKK